MEVVFEVSPNSYDWVARTTTVDNGLMKITLPTDQENLYTRLRIAGRAEKQGGRVAAIDWIEVQGTINR